MQVKCCLNKRMPNLENASCITTAKHVDNTSIFLKWFLCVRTYHLMRNERYLIKSMYALMWQTWIKTIQVQYISELILCTLNWRRWGKATWGFQKFGIPRSICWFRSVRVLRVRTQLYEERCCGFIACCNVYEPGFWVTKSRNANGTYSTDFVRLLCILWGARHKLKRDFFYFRQRARKYSFRCKNIPKSFTEISSVTGVECGCSISKLHFHFAESA